MQVEAAEPGHGFEPRASGHKEQNEHEEATEDGDHEDPVEKFERALDAPADGEDDDATEKRRNADPVDGAGIGSDRQSLGEQKEDGGGGRSGPCGPTDLEEVQSRVDPRPQRG